MITPAMSMMSAVEGLKVVEPSLAEWVVPITAVISLVLFAVQRYGTHAVGRLFGPVMIAWFVSIGACGVKGILGHPQILKALSPTYAATFVVGHARIAFFALAAVVLAVTGAEALYADMGHFGRRPSPGPGYLSCCRHALSVISAKARWCSATSPRRARRSFYSLRTGRSCPWCYWQPPQRLSRLRR